MRHFANDTKDSARLVRDQADKEGTTEARASDATAAQLRPSPRGRRETGGVEQEREPERGQLWRRAPATNASWH
jgi:hypothetical protein